MTAAHCVQKSLTHVRLGQHDANAFELDNEDVKVIRMEKHPRFNKPFMSNDIAILYLERDVEFSGKETLFVDGNNV